MKWVSQVTFDFSVYIDSDLDLDLDWEQLSELVT